MSQNSSCVGTRKDNFRRPLSNNHLTRDAFDSRWKNNVERRSKFKSLSIDATYDGLDERFIRRANYCECVIDLCISIRNHFDRIIQKNGGTVVIEPIRNEQLNSLLINVLLSDSSHFEDHATFNITASSSSSSTTTTDGCTSNDSSGSEIPSSRGTAPRGSRSSGKRRRKQHHIIRRSHSIENEKSNTSSSVVTFASDEDDERENDFMWEPLSLSTEYADAYFMCDEEMILNRALSVSPMAMGGTDRGSSTEVERLLGIVPVDPKNRRVQESKKAHSVEVIEVMSEMTESLSANMTITMDSPLTSPCSTLCLPSASSEAWHSLFSDEGYYGAERAAASGLDCDFGMDLYE